MSFGSVTIRGNRLTEAVQQTATVGIPIPFGYGKYLATGNVIAASELREKVIRRRQGKGGVKTEDYEYTCDYAIAFAEGPIYGYWTIKRQGKVVYSSDPTTPIEDQDYATKWLQGATLYYGTEDQLPDSTIESFKGVGRVSAFRGLAYIVLENDNVTANQGAVPPYEAILVGSADLYLTSKPYPVEVVEGFSLNQTLLPSLTLNEYEDSLVVQGGPVGGQLRATLQLYSTEPEAFDLAGGPTTGALQLLLRTYDNYPPEAFDLSGSIASGELRTLLIQYNNYQPEAFDVTGGPIGGALS